VSIINAKDIELSSELDAVKRIPLLNSIALASPRSEVRQAIQFLREALSLSEQVGIPLFVAQTHLNLSRWLGNGGFFEEAFEHLLIAEKLFNELGDNDALLDVQLVESLILFEKKDFEKSFEIANSVYQYRKDFQNHFLASSPTRVSADRFSGEMVSIDKSKHNNDLKLAIAIRVLAKVEAQRMDYFKALSYIDENFALWHTLGDSPELAHSLHNAGMIYSRIPDFARALTFFKRALAIYRSMGFENNSIITLTDLAAIRIETGDLTTAFSELNEARNLVLLSKYRPAEIRVCTIFAHYYIIKKEYHEAYTWAKKALESAILERAPLKRTDGYALLGKILYLQDKYQDAIEILLKGLASAKKEKWKEIEVRCFKYLYLSHKALHHPSEALEYLELYQSMEATVLEKGRKHNAEAIQERFRKRISETTQAVYRTENNELLQEVERLSNEVAGLLLQILKKDEVLGQLEKESSALINYSKETQEFLRPILTRVSEELRESENEKNVIDKLQSVQRYFTNALEKKYPSLTEAELKVCTLLRLGMSSHEIASSLGISIRTVENHRLHIRQKLHLDHKHTIQRVFRDLSLSST
jgi:tetratricopeptide (TPR) repeat protein